MTDDMPQINTGNGYSNDLAATTNERLKKTVIELRSLVVTEKTESKKTRETIENLTKTIKKLDNKNGQLQNAVFRLTLVTVALSIVQALPILKSLLVWLGNVLF